MTIFLNLPPPLVAVSAPEGAYCQGAHLTGDLRGTLKERALFAFDVSVIEEPLIRILPGAKP